MVEAFLDFFLLAYLLYYISLIYGFLSGSIYLSDNFSAISEESENESEKSSEFWISPRALISPSLS